MEVGPGRWVGGGGEGGRSEWVSPKSVESMDITDLANKLWAISGSAPTHRPQVNRGF